MVGGQGGAGRTPAELNSAELGSADLGSADLGSAGLAPEVRAAYDAAAAGCVGGPERMYAPLARALVAAAPLPVSAAAGSLTWARAPAWSAGPRSPRAPPWWWPPIWPVAMLRLGGPAQHPVAASATALPFRDQAFDLVVATVLPQPSGRARGCPA